MAEKVDTVFGPIEVRCKECRLRNLEYRGGEYGELLGVAHLLVEIWDGKQRLPSYWSVTQVSHREGRGPDRTQEVDPVVKSMCPAKRCRSRAVDISVEDLDEAMRVLPRDFGKSSPSKPLWL